MNYKALSFQDELSGKLKIAIVSISKYALPYFLTDFMSKYKGVGLSIEVSIKAEVVKSLEANLVDFAMASVIPKPLKINGIELMKNKLFLVGGKQFNYSGKNLSKSIFEKLPLIYRAKSKFL